MSLLNHTHTHTHAPHSAYVSLIKHTLNTITCKTHSSFYKTHTFKQTCTQWTPVYLRLLLLGCDPARPGWSGLWRFWSRRDINGEINALTVTCRFSLRSFSSISAFGCILNSFSLDQSFCPGRRHQYRSIAAIRHCSDVISLVTSSAGYLSDTVPERARSLCYTTESLQFCFQKTRECWLSWDGYMASTCASYCLCQLLQQFPCIDM